VKASRLACVALLIGALITSGIWDRLASAQDAVLAGAEAFVRGDADVSGFLSLGDMLAIAGYLFLGEPEVLSCESAADANDDGIGFRVVLELPSCAYGD